MLAVWLQRVSAQLLASAPANAQHSLRQQLFILASARNSRSPTRVQVYDVQRRLGMMIIVLANLTSCPGADSLGRSRLLPYAP